MGLKFSKQGLEKDGKFTLAHAQHHLINYLTKSFRIRNLVSKQRRRMLIGGYDLDMTYITERVLAMSFPAERMRAMYRNPLWQVRSVLDTRHPGHYKVYNLCIEETYDPSHFHGRVESFPFDDNHVPPLHMIKLFCQSVDSWLSRDPKNIAVIHCMAGKGRTGLMVCAYLVYSGMTAEAALQLYAQKRTTNNEGVSIPSQRRYVGYWADVLSFPRGVSKGPPNVNFPQSCNRELRRIRLYDTVNTDSVFCVVTELQQIPGQLYRPPVEVSKSCCRQIRKGYQRPSSPRYYFSFIDCDEEENEQEMPRLVVQMDTESPMLYQKTCLDYYFDKPLQVTGDVRVIFYQKMIGGRLFYACFNTSFIKNSLLQMYHDDRVESCVLVGTAPLLQMGRQMMSLTTS
ncbi:phosphatidylinositol 3,4,5-trisphosphate 3-phosphatase and protein-tyrosine-phosphatase PTEN1 isoform X2 [Malania oleifera]|uniref:phosphatidylinositol 3,4,5-trisphosphate 3-phosphatase and protein-tyrosine-phosphatase PTEN1 isoform X2 n=1 Tax=Malania oleifera TaxID=397392 RepID=UPI0025AE8632|nr:phosphatidylinositol 3,4,5-trisphosphate 3-phosphatase and protein-tyrosine-phosphatase PTEN1 isoform X2 [Malania oleifera]XP_057967734.1 phosphatidylinositol 3,4,5-trisphosphate 3-phosphatase and protein-tyrosine-phosphatase PTEN1 isoform X2 [Malania oleifera]